MSKKIRVPFIEATPDLLSDGEEAAVIPVVDRGTGARGVILGGCGLLADEDGVSAFFPDLGPMRVDASEVYLDLRRPEVLDRVLRTWWKCLEMPPIPYSPEFLLFPDGVWSLGASHPDQVQCPGVVLIHTFGEEGSGVDTEVPSLSTLPEEDTLAWAAFYVEQTLKGGV